MNVIWTISIVMMLVSGLMIIGNLWITFGGLFKKRKKFESLIPFVGGIIGTIGIIISPAAQLRHLWWIPLVADLGCLPLLLAVIVDQLWKKRWR
jgi:hypothetical protein